MESVLARAFQEEVRCLICMDTLMDPVTIKCGHTFCRPCLRLAWEEATTPARCPACREPSQQGEVRSNVVLSRVVSAVRKASLRRFLSSQEHQCGTHRVTKHMFCEEDKNLLCEHCSQAREHRGHTHPPVERAAEEKREVILQHTETLHGEMTAELYVAAPHPSLQGEGEGPLVESFLNQGRRGLEQLWTVERHFLQKQAHLRQVYQDLMTAYQKADVELLQQLEDALESCKCALRFMPQPVEPQLSPPSVPGLTETLSRYRGTVSFGPWIQSPPLLPGHGRTSRGARGHADSTEEGAGCRLALGAPDLFLLSSVPGSSPGALCTTSPLLPLYLEKPVGRVGVFLDLDNGTLRPIPLGGEPFQGVQDPVGGRKEEQCGRHAVGNPPQGRVCPPVFMAGKGGATQTASGAIPTRSVSLWPLSLVLWPGWSPDSVAPPPCPTPSPPRPAPYTAPWVLNWVR
ncbi:tripartite motif-containing protein 43-like [Thomomys bottae]